MYRTKAFLIMAITLTPAPDEELRIKTEQKERETDFADVKKYVTYIVLNRHKIFETEQLHNELKKVLELNNYLVEQATIANKRLDFALDKAVKAGCNRKDLLKHISQIK